MSNSPDTFESVVEGVFTPEELIDFDNLFTGRLVERLYPGRQEFLENLDELSTILKTANSQSEAKGYLFSFLKNMAEIDELEPDMNMMLTGAWSCLADYETGEHGYEIYRRPTNLVGSYYGLNICSWYDTPLGESISGDSLQYYKPLGLFICLREVVVEYGDGVSERLEIARVPLNHGEPELFRILRAE